MRPRAPIALWLALAFWPGRPDAGTAPAYHRVISLNPCLDAIVLAVADPSQIVALSRYSQQPSQSAVSAVARRFPFTEGSAEDIVGLKPDLVLGSGMGSLELTHVLPRLHIHQVSFAVPTSIKESLAQVSRVAALVGHADRGARLNARIEAALEAAAPRPGERRFRALVYEAHGLASGPHTLMDELMRRAGFDNLAGRYGLRRTLDVPLEDLIADPPDVLLSGRLSPDEPSWADRVLSHPALRALASRMKRESFPEPLLFCAGPILIPAAQALAAARVNAEQGRSQ